MTEVKPTILVVDDEESVIESFKLILEDKYNLITATSGKEALEKFEKENVNLVILDILIPDMNGIEILRKLKEMNPNIDIVIVTAVKTVKTAVESIKLGAYDYITKPFDMEEILSIIDKIMEKQKLVKEITYLRSELKESIMFDTIVGQSAAMKQIYELVIEMGKNDTNVIIYGESGTGKELIARAIHFNGIRKDKPFVAVDCASIPDNLLESELFGHEKGAFTDATSQKIGKFELASGGTLFLDEISNLKLDMQSKILRAIQEKEIQRIGSNKNIKVDVRIICATNIDLKEAVAKNKFREDLYYRINVVPIYLPPLRERKEDIPLLVKHFIQKYNKKLNKDIQGITDQALDLLMNYSWPGNVRELQNLIERLVVLTKEKLITHKHFPLEILLSTANLQEEDKQQLSLRHVRNEFEKQYILGILAKVNWNQIEASKILNIHRNTLIFKIRKLKLEFPRKRGRRFKGWF